MKEINILDYIQKQPNSGEKKFFTDYLNPARLKYLNKIIEEIVKESSAPEKQTAAKPEEASKNPNSSQPASGVTIQDQKPQEPKDYSNLREAIQKIIHKIQTESVKMPVFPQVAQKVLDMIDTQKATIAGIAREIKYDAMITSKILEVSNSAFYGSTKDINSVEQAIVKIGLVEVTKHLYRFATKDIFKFENPVIADLGNIISDHMSASSYASQLYAIKNKLAYPEKYLLLTMFHDIGKMWLLQLINDFMIMEKQKFELDEAGIIEVFKKLHVPFGVSLLSKWQFDVAYIDIVKKHHQKFDNDSKQLLVAKFGNLVAKICGYTEYDTSVDIVSEDMAVIDYLKIRENTMDKMKEEVEEFMASQKKESDKK